MKKIINVIIVATASAAAPAVAAEKCLALDPTGTSLCAVTPSDYYGHVEWSATCTYMGKTTPIKGIGVCSSLKPVNVSNPTGETADDLPTTENADENIYCWCKIISPAISKWVYSGYGQGDNPVEDCQYKCGRNCTHPLTDTYYYPTYIRQAMFTTLGQ